MQRLVFDPIRGSWMLENLKDNGTVVMDCSELTPEEVGIRYDRQEILSSLLHAANTLTPPMSIASFKKEQDTPKCDICSREVDVKVKADSYICEACASSARIVPWSGLKSINQPEDVVLKAKPRTRDRRCHELAGRFMFDNPTWILVHAVLHNWDSSGLDYPHAFTEKDGVVYDPTLNKFYKKEDYYAFFSVSVEATYTVEQMGRTALKYGEWCAWHVLEAGKNEEEELQTLP